MGALPPAPYYGGGAFTGPPVGNQQKKPTYYGGGAMPGTVAKNASIQAATLARALAAPGGIISRPGGAKKAAPVKAPPWTGNGGYDPAGLRTPAPAAAAPVPAAATSGTMPPVSGNYQDLFQNIMQAAISLYNTPNGAANSLINPNAIMAGLSGAEVNPNQVGKDAGLGFNEQIAQDNRNYGTTQNQNAQNIADIGNWFKQAADTQNAGAADNAKAFAAQLSGSQDAASAFMNALGGSASPGAAGIANTSDIAQAGLRGAGLAGQEFDNNMKGVVGLDQAQQLANEKTAGINRLQTLMDNIAQLTGQKGAAVAQAKDNAQQALFGQKSGLATMKANLVGNLFNEKQGLRQQKLAELGGLSNTILGTALAPSQIQGAEIANQGAAANVAARKLSNQGIAKQVAALGGTGNADISQANPGTRQQIQSLVQTRFLDPSGQLRQSPAAIRAAIQSELVSVQGWKNGPALQSYINGLTRDIVTPNRVQAYDKSHKTNFYKQGGYGA